MNIYATILKRVLVHLLHAGFYACNKMLAVFLNHLW